MRLSLAWRRLYLLSMARHANELAENQETDLMNWDVSSGEFSDESGISYLPMWLRSLRRIFSSKEWTLRETAKL